MGPFTWSGCKNKILLDQSLTATVFCINSCTGTCGSKNLYTRTKYVNLVHVVSTDYSCVYVHTRVHVNLLNLVGPDSAGMLSRRFECDTLLFVC